VSEKKQKVKNWEQTTVSCEVASSLISVPTEFLFKEALQHQTRENIREIPRKF